MNALGRATPTPGAPRPPRATSGPGDTPTIAPKFRVSYCDKVAVSTSPMLGSSAGVLTVLSFKCIYLQLMTSLIKFECTEVCHRYNKLSIKHASHTYKCYNEPRKNQAFVCVRCIDSLLYASNSILWVTSEVNSTNNSDSTEFDSANSYDCGEIMVN